MTPRRVDGVAGLATVIEQQFYRPSSVSSPVLVSLDARSGKQPVDHLIGQGVHGIFVLGTDPETLALLPQSLAFVTELMQQKGL
jgi:hypothetical protein